MDPLGGFGYIQAGDGVVSCLAQVCRGKPVVMVIGAHEAEACSVKLPLCVVLADGWMDRCTPE